MVKIIAHNTEEVKNVPMSELVTMENSGFAFMPSAMRSVDKSHVHSLSLVHPSELPALDVVHTDSGYVVLNGRHRQAAILRFMLAGGTAKKYPEYNDLDFASQDKLIKQHVAARSEELKEDVMQKLLTSTQVPVKVGAFNNEYDINVYAMTANFKNGKGVNEKSKTAIAMDMHDLCKIAGIKKTDKAIAKECGISGAALSMALRDREAKKAPLEDTASAEGTEGAEEAETPAQSNNKLVKKFTALLKELNNIRDSDPSTYDDCCDLLDTFINGSEVQSVNPNTAKNAPYTPTDVNGKAV